MTSKDDKLFKISFTGDIMCEMPLLKASKISKNKYDFDDIFVNVKDIFAESDYVVGNLETICTGKKSKLTDHIYSFNSPVEFAESVKDAGIDLVTTATNHALDRGIEGLIDNIKILEDIQLENIGTYKDKDSSEKVFIKEIGGIRIAYLNYTFGTNANINGIELKDDQLHHIKLLKSQTTDLRKYSEKESSKKLKSIIARNLFKVISLKTWLSIKRKLGLKNNTAYQDNYVEELNDYYLKPLEKEINFAKKNADLVIMCMHSGGQFHPEPGNFSKYMMTFLDENDVDLVVGNHAHVVQKTERFKGGMFGAYCLGNFSISPSSVYVLHDDLPDYSILLHTYISKELKKIKQLTFTILKIEENTNGSLTVYPINELFDQASNEDKETIQKNVTQIYNRFTNKKKKIVDIKREYKL